MSVRMDRVEEGIYTVIDGGTTADVAWAYGQPTFEQRADTIVDLLMTAPPAGKHLGLAGGQLFQPFTSAVYRVLPVVEGSLTKLELNFDVDVAVNTVAGDTPTTVRDKLVTELTSNAEFDPWTAAPQGADEFILTPTSFASIYQVRLISGLEFVSADEPDAYAELYEQEMDFTVQVQSFSKHRNLVQGASAISTDLQALFRVQQTHTALSQYGIAVVSVGPPTDLSAIAGSNWETRASFDIDFAVQMRQTAPADVFDSVAVDFTVNTPAGTSDQLTVTIPNGV